jgi:hypothetical protein
LRFFALWPGNCGFYKEGRAGPEECSSGGKERSFGVKECSFGPKESSFGQKECSSGAKECSSGPAEAFVVAGAVGAGAAAKTGGGGAALYEEYRMATRDDYIPSNDAEFDVFFKNIVQYVSDKCSGSPPAWTHSPQAARPELVARYTAWSAAYGPTLKPTCTKPEREELKRVRKIVKKYLRGFVNAYLRYYPDVTDDDRRKMGLHVPDPLPTPSPDPQTRPEFEIRVRDIRTLSLLFHDQGSERRAKPKGIGGAVIHWAVLDHIPADTGELTNSVLATRTPHTLVFTDGERGKTVYIAMQWQNRKGHKGKFSEIQSAIVP